MGLGGPLGDGRAWWSWIALADFLEAMRFAIETSAVAGPLNVVSPQPARQSDFARALGRALRRPVMLPAPAFALRILLGRDLADEMLLAGQRVRPALLAASGFRFREPELGPLLARLLEPGNARHGGAGPGSRA
jgi:NAD dependent epimerase/dehydratase family enzyme